MRRVAVLIVSISIMTMWATVSARTWVIQPDGSGDAPTIQAGIDSASAGDSILVMPGTYDEHLTMKSDITLMSQSGYEVTFLIPDDNLGPVITCSDVTGAVISGFSFETVEVPSGAAVFCENSSVTISENRFYDMGATDKGGAIACFDGRGVIENNIFDENGAGDWGGAIYLDGASPVITGNQFFGNSAQYGGAIACLNQSSPDILDNTFTENTAARQAGCIHCRYSSSPLIEGNVFRANTAGGSGGAIVVHELSSPEIRYNVFWENHAVNQGALGVSYTSSVVCEHNTFYWNWAEGLPSLTLPDGGSAIGCYSGSSLEVRNCIIAASTGPPAVACFGDAVITLECNCFWLNDSNYLGCSPGLHDFRGDPLFCDPDNGDFTLDESSPCTSSNSPNGCGLIGALSVGCCTAGVRPDGQPDHTSWSALKALYR
jgi:hypothetical protein